MHLHREEALMVSWDLEDVDLEGWDLEGWDPAAANGMPIRQKLPADSELLGAE